MLNVITFIYKGEIKLRGDAYQKFLQLANQFQLKILDDKVQQKKSRSFKTGLTDLPLELLTTICSYLPTFDVLRNVGRVSKKFYDLSRNPHSHINVCLDLITIDRSTVDFLRSATLMRKLSIDYSCPGRSHVREMLRDMEAFVEPDDLFLTLKDHHYLRSLEI